MIATVPLRKVSKVILMGFSKASLQMAAAMDELFASFKEAGSEESSSASPAVEQLPPPEIPPPPASNGDGGTLQ